MEKIRYAPLVDHLKGHRDQYNQLYLQYELKHGGLDTVALNRWIVQTIEPLVRTVTEQKPESVPEVFHALYATLLPLLGNGSAVIHESEYARLWKLCEKMPALVIASPRKVLQALGSALASVRSHQPGKVMDWISMMEAVAGYCTSYNDLLDAGRITAWFCGLAHLRERCLATFPDLPGILKDALQKICPLPLERVLSATWMNEEETAFVSGAGGFVGLNGYFLQSPLLMRMGGQVLATDRINSCLVFADAFGTVLLPQALAKEAEITPASDLQLFKSRYGKEIAAFDDISSCVLQGTTFFVTRRSSYFILIYSCSNEL
jgi:hypothetical protein